MAVGGAGAITGAGGMQAPGAGQAASTAAPALTAQVPVGRTSSFQGWLCSDNSSLAAGLNTSVILFLHCCSF